MGGLTDEEAWAIARRVCTASELEVLRTRERLERSGRHYGYRSVAEELGIAWTTVRDRIDRAERRIQRAANA